MPPRYGHTVIDSPRESRGNRDMRAIRQLLPYLWSAGAPGTQARVLLALGMLVTAKIAAVYVPMLYKAAVDALSPTEGMAVVLPLGLVVAYGAGRILTQGFQELREIVFARVAQNGIHQVALQTFRHLHRLSMRFHMDRQTGGLSRSLERGTAGIENLLYYLLFQIAPTVLEILMVAGILWALYDWRFPAITFVTVILYVIYTLAITRWRLEFRRRMMETEREANTKAIDSLLNYETVKYFGNEEHEARRYDRSLADYERAAVKSATSLSLLNIGQGTIIAIGVTLVMLLAAAEIAAGQMTVGDFVLVNAYMLQLYRPLDVLGMVYRQLRQSLIDVEAMFRLLDQQVEVPDGPGARPLAVTQGRIEFDHVRFGYESRREILKDVSFAVPPGWTVAIVGSSGAGKSTVSRLLFRFYDVDEGAIRIDGQDIRAVTQASLRAAIGIVPQDTVLFNDTIYYNIAYGRPDATRAEVEEAARLARIDDFVRALPQGYDTPVGERGLKLSGGERQRVAIARTILKRPRILLFDEATSALDTRTEKEIQESLRAISRDRTTIVIAHRLSTIVDADEILVLEDGRVIERGTHAALVAGGGVFAAMWARQREAAEREPAEISAD